MKLVSKFLNVRRQLLFRFANYSICLLRVTPKALQLPMSELVPCQSIANAFRPQRVSAQVPDYLFPLETKAEFETVVTIGAPLLVDEALRFQRL
jgi:hypothetical protein